MQPVETLCLTFECGCEARFSPVQARIVGGFIPCRAHADLETVNDICPEVELLLSSIFIMPPGVCQA